MSDYSLIYSDNVKIITDENFENEVLGASVPVLLFFYEPMHGHCRKFAPAVGAVADEYGPGGENAGKMIFGMIKAQENPLTCEAYRITGYPTVKCFINGKIRDYTAGYNDFELSTYCATVLRVEINNSFRQLVEIIQSGSGLNFNEMSLFNKAFESLVISKKTAWENADAAERTAETDDLLNFCNETLRVFNDYLVPAPDQYEQNVFFLNTKALCYKYISDVLTDDAQQEAIDNAQQLYEQAYKATDFLPIVHPFVLRVILGFSVFHNDNRHDSLKAAAIAKDGFERAIQELDALKEDAYKESSSLLIQIRDYIAFLTSDAELESE